MFLLYTYIHIHTHVYWISVSKVLPNGESWSEQLENPWFYLYSSISETALQALMSAKLFKD